MFIYLWPLQESVLNLTVTASNEFENVSFDLLVEIVGKVHSCELTDFNKVTPKVWQ